jgi:hypothetical protein
MLQWNRTTDEYMTVGAMAAKHFPPGLQSYMDGCHAMAGWENR